MDLSGLLVQSKRLFRAPKRPTQVPPSPRFGAPGGESASSGLFARVASPLMLPPEARRSGAGREVSLASSTSGERVSSPGGGYDGSRCRSGAEALASLGALVDRRVRKLTEAPLRLTVVDDLGCRAVTAFPCSAGTSNRSQK